MPGPREGSGPLRFRWTFASALSLGLVLAACSHSERVEAPRLASNRAYGTPSPVVVGSNAPVPKGGGTYKIGLPYKMDGIWYVPREDVTYNRVGTASWYGVQFHGRRTANGEIFDRNALMAAHPTLPLPSYAYVTNLATGRTILVRVNDRGPYARGRVIDLSEAAASALGYRNQGTAQVRVRYAGRAPLDGNDLAERRFLASQGWARQEASLAQPVRTW